MKKLFFIIIAMTFCLTISAHKVSDTLCLGSVGFGGATPNVVVTENHTEDTSGASYDAYKETWVSFSGHKSQSYHNEGNMSIGLTLGF